MIEQLLREEQQALLAPVGTGGVGREAVRDFYARQFISFPTCPTIWKWWGISGD